jgi:hypothetical protein
VCIRGSIPLDLVRMPSYFLNSASHTNIPNAAAILPDIRFLHL